MGERGATSEPHILCCPTRAKKIYPKRECNGVKRLTGARRIFMP